MELETQFFSNGIPLDCTIHAPTGESGSVRFPAVILCHGLSRHRNDGLDRLANALGDAGIASLRFNFRGCGEHARSPYQQLAASELSDDILAALSFAETIPFLDPDRMGLAGISLGASLAVWVGGMGDERIKGIVSMAAMADCKTGLQSLFSSRGADYDAFLNRLRHDAQIDAATGYSQVVNRMEMFAETDHQAAACILESLLTPENGAYINLRSISNFIRLRPILACNHISCPIFYMHGADDTLIDPTDAQRLFLATASEEKRLRIYPDVDHNMPMAARREIVFRDIVDWFDELFCSSGERNAASDPG